MNTIPEDVKKKIEEKYPPTFEVIGIRYDDAVFIAKRKAAEFGYSLSTPEQSAVQSDKSIDKVLKDVNIPDQHDKYCYSEAEAKEAMRQWGEIRRWEGFDFALNLIEEMYSKNNYQHDYDITDCARAKANRLSKDKIRKQSAVQMKGDEGLNDLTDATKDAIGKLAEKHNKADAEFIKNNTMRKFTDEEIKAAKETRDMLIKEDMPTEMKALYMAGEIVMWDELHPSPPSAVQPDNEK